MICGGEVEVEVLQGGEGCVLGGFLFLVHLLGFFGGCGVEVGCGFMRRSGWIDGGKDSGVRRSLLVWAREGAEEEELSAR